MTQPASRPSITVEAYFALERGSREKHEFWNGQVFAMAGASPEHNLIAANIAGALRELLRETPCRVYSSDQKVHISRENGYVYADVTVGCDSPRYHPEHTDVLLNPRLVIEVLSDSTERFDRGAKSAGYRSLPSLTDYLLVSQHEPRIEHYARQHDGSWSLRDFGAADVITIASLGIALPVSEAYFKVLNAAQTSG